MEKRRAMLLALGFTTVALAGCADDNGGGDLGPPTLQDGAVDLWALVNETAASIDFENITFRESVVDVAVQFVADLYEPNIAVSDTGTIYIAGHTIVVATTGAPAFVSRDDGATWHNLPVAGPVALPEPIPGGSPPGSDEIYIVTGEDGYAYGVDINLATFPLTIWGDDGQEMVHFNPNAFDKVGGLTSECHPGGLNDRPWAAYANGTLVLVNNPGELPLHAQIGVMQVPPAVPVGLGTPLGPEWNFCAGDGGSWIPGPVTLRDDGLFAVPQIFGTDQSSATNPAGGRIGPDQRLVLLMGNAADVQDIRSVEIFHFETAAFSTSVYGNAVFDGEGTLFAGVHNNTFHLETRTQNGLFGPTEVNVLVGDDGGFMLAASQDDGETFVHQTFRFPTKPLEHFWMEPNPYGPGALVVWAHRGDTNDTSDWYMAQVHVGEDGAPVLRDAQQVLDEAYRPSPHITTAAVGPDGRIYQAMYRNGGSLFERVGGTPVSVLIQEDGPRFQVNGDAVTEDE